MSLNPDYETLPPGYEKYLKEPFKDPKKELFLSGIRKYVISFALWFLWLYTDYNIFQLFGYFFYGLAVGLTILYIYQSNKNRPNQ